ncbi:MAG: ATP synthase subunit I [Pseudomonadota bacterium]
MSMALEYTASFIAGILLGLFFLQGLWVTIRNLDKTRHPAMRLLISILVRFSLVLAGFLFLARYAGWQHVLIAVAGFTLLRIYIVRRFSQEQDQNKEIDR